jgi:hypothetical protein
MAKSKKKASKTVTTQKQAKKGESSRVKQVAGRKRTAHENSETDDNEPQQSRQRSKRARNMPNIDEVHEKETSESENEVINVENSEDDAVVVEEKDEVYNLLYLKRMTYHRCFRLTTMMTVTMSPLKHTSKRSIAQRTCY